MSLPPWEWARVASIHRPADYESAALTRLSYGPSRSESIEAGNNARRRRYLLVDAGAGAARPAIGNRSHGRRPRRPEALRLVGRSRNDRLGGRHEPDAN